MIRARRSYRPILSAALNLLLAATFGFSQQKEKPKLKDFGSSLDKLKWDPKLNQAVLSKAKSKQTDATEDEIVRVETTLVVNDVLVLDAHGNPVSGLSEPDFLVTEDDQPQKVGMFSLGDNATVPRSVVLVIDYSGSQLPFIKTSIAAAKSMVDKLGPLDRLAIVTDDVELIQDFTADKKKLKRKLDSLDPWSTNRRTGESKQYSALMATLNEAFSAEDQRPIVIFQTDGDELLMLRNEPPPPPLPPEAEFPKNILKNVPKFTDIKRTNFSLDDISRAAEKSRATIYTVISGPQFLGLPQEEQMKRARLATEQRFAAIKSRLSQDPDPNLRRVAEWQLSPLILKYGSDATVRVQSALAKVATATGGWAMFLEAPSQADEIYSRILSDINRRYIIGYYPTNKERDGKRRKINITVRDHPDYTVVGRRWYFAPGPEE